MKGPGFCESPFDVEEDGLPKRAAHEHGRQGNPDGSKTVKGNEVKFVSVGFSAPNGSNERHDVYLRYCAMARPRPVPDAICSLDIAGADQDRLIAMFKALGNPRRFEIMKFLVTHPRSITGKIVEYLPIAQATTSQHLKVLRDAGLITGTIEGPAVNYRLNERALRWFRSVIVRCF